MSYFGIDLHLKTSEICEISEEGEVITRTELGTNREPKGSFCPKRLRVFLRGNRWSWSIGFDQRHFRAVVERLKFEFPRYFDKE